MPTFGDQISTVCQNGFSLHETGHATDSPDADTLRDSFQEYGKGLINILEDIRIEKLVKAKYPGSKKFFSNMYKELVLEHNFFSTKDQYDPFDFNAKRFLDRVNCHFKVGARAAVRFNKAEQALIDEMNEMKTWEDVLLMAGKLKAIAKKNPPQTPISPPEFSPSNWSDDDQDESENEESESESAMGEGPDSESADGFSGESEDEGSESSDDSDDDSVDIDENELGGSLPLDGFSPSDESSEGDDGESSEGDDGEESDSDAEGSTDADGSKSTPSTDGEESDSEEFPGSKPAETDSGNNPDAESGEGESGESDSDNNPTPSVSRDSQNVVDIDDDDLEEPETVTSSDSAFSEIVKNSGAVMYIPKTKDIPWIAQPWTDVQNQASWAGDNAYYVRKLQDFRKNIKNTVTAMVSEFNRSSAGAVARRTSYKDSGALDPLKMIQYRYNDNIFKRRKLVRDGKNHGVIMFVDFTGSMSYNRRNRAIMRQVLVTTEFCKKINIPFRVYGWADNFVRSDSGEYYGTKGTGVGMTEVLTSDMPKATYDKYAAWCLDGSGMTNGNSTPLVKAMFQTLPIVKKFRDDCHVDVVKMLFFTDGEGSGGMNGWGASTIIDDETNTKYSYSDFAKDFFKGDKAFDGGNYYKSKRPGYLSNDQQQVLISKVLKDRYNVSTVFMYMNSTREINQKLNAGQWSDKDAAARRCDLKSGTKLVQVGQDDSYTFVAIKDGYDIETGAFRLSTGKNATNAQIKKAFRKVTNLRKSSTVFATITAKAIAVQ